MATQERKTLVKKLVKNSKMIDFKDIFVIINNTVIL